MKRLLILFISIFCILVAYAEHVAIDDAKQEERIKILETNKK